MNNSFVLKRFNGMSFEKMEFASNYRGSVKLGTVLDSIHFPTERLFLFKIQVQ